MFEKGKRYWIQKKEVIKHFGKLPTVRVQQLIVRQNGHPFGDWIVSKPTRKYEYIMEVI